MSQVSMLCCFFSASLFPHLGMFLLFSSHLSKPTAVLPMSSLISISPDLLGLSRGCSPRCDCWAAVTTSSFCASLPLFCRVTLAVSPPPGGTEIILPTSPCQGLGSPGISQRPHFLNTFKRNLQEGVGEMFIQRWPNTLGQQLIT